MDKLLEYIRNIGYFLILMSLVTNVMPDNSYKKYCRMFCGIILVVLVINPFYEFMNFDGDIKDIFVTADYESQVKELEIQIKMKESSTKERAINEYENLIVKEVQGLANIEGLYIVGAHIELIEEPEVELVEVKLIVTENVEDRNNTKDKYNNSTADNGSNIENINDSKIIIDNIIIGDTSNSSSNQYMTKPKVLAFITKVAEHLKIDTEIIVVELYEGDDYGK